MGRTKEEIAADLVWRYVESVREADAAGQRVRFSRAELEALVEALDTAAQVPPALDGPEIAACRAAVRERVHGCLAHPPAAEISPAPRQTRPSFWEQLRARVVPAWMLAGSITATAGLVLALGSVNLWHHAAPIIKIRRVVAEAPDNVRDLDELQAHELIPRMVRNELEPADERSLMWHMLLCPGCFRQYVDLQHTGRTAAEIRREFTLLVRR